MLGGEQQAASAQLMLQDYKKFKHGKEGRRKLKFNTLNSISWHKLSCTTNM